MGFLALHDRKETTIQNLGGSLHLFWIWSWIWVLSKRHWRWRINAHTMQMNSFTLKAATLFGSKDISKSCGMLYMPILNLWPKRDSLVYAVWGFKDHERSITDNIFELMTSRDKMVAIGYVFSERELSLCCLLNSLRLRIPLYIQLTGRMPVPRLNLKQLKFLTRKYL